MKTVTLTPQYIRKVATTYRHLKQGGALPAQELAGVALAANRCLQAHDAGYLLVSPDVRLPVDAVARMLTSVRADAAMQLRAIKSANDEPVPVPEDFVPEQTAEVKTLVRRAKERLASLFAVPSPITTSSTHPC